MQASLPELIDLDLIDFDPDNPNAQDVGVFNEVVESMRNHGFLENAVIRPIEGGRFMCVSGEHRLKAARVVGMRQAPCLVKDYEEQDAKIDLVRMNSLRGKIDPERFTSLYNKLRRTMSPEDIKRKMGFASRDSEFQKMIKQVEADLPEQHREEFR